MKNSPIRVLVLYGDYWHPAEVIRRGLESFREEDICLDFMTDAKDMLTVPMLDQYDVIMNCKCNQLNEGNQHTWFDPGVTEVGPEELEAFVRSGRGFLSVHSGNAFYAENDSPEYIAFVGNYFVKHPPRCDVQVSPCGDHPITEGLAPFTIRDEHYEITVTAPDARQILRTESETGGVQNGGYVREIGNGRLCVLTPGHILSVWEHPSFRRLLARSIRWCAGRTKL